MDIKRLEPSQEAEATLTFFIHSQGLVTPVQLKIILFGLSGTYRTARCTHPPPQQRLGRLLSWSF